MNKSILLLGLQTDPNLGDALISRCTEYMVKDICRELGIDDIDVRVSDIRGCDYTRQLALDKEQEQMAARRREEQRLKKERSVKYRASMLTRKCLITLLPALAAKGRPERDRKRAEEKEQKERERLRQKEEMKNKRLAASIERACFNAAENIDENTAAVIFVGGGLIKYSHQHLALLVQPYIRRAQELGVPVMLSAVGVEGYDSENSECALLRELLALDCVKRVTVRDDIETLRRCYLTRDIPSAAVADPAMYAPKLYDALPAAQREQSGVIGLGVARANLFADHGIGIDEAALLAMWADVVDELEKRGRGWKLFCNGSPDDRRFALKLLEYIGREEEQALLLPSPESPERLINDITGFEGIIACRLHSAIIAKAYGVPAVEPVWNPKQFFFGERYGIAERFVSPDRLSGALLVERLENAIKDGYPADSGEDIQRTRSELKNFISEVF